MTRSSFLKLIPFLALSAAPSIQASSFKVNIGELLLQNLQPGQTYDLKELLNLPYRVEYDGKQEAEVLITPSGYQEEADMKPGYELVPDLSWISVGSSQTYVGAKGVVETQVRFTIPDDDKLLGKKYVVYLWARTKNLSQSFTVGLGAKSRFLLTIAPERATDVSNDTAPAERASMNFKVDPQETRTRKPLKSGGQYKLGKKVLGRNVMIVNGDNVERTFKLEAVSGEELSIPLPEGYEWPKDPKAVTFKKDTLVVKPLGRAVLPAVLAVPADPALKGKKLFYVVQVKPQGKGVTSSIVARYLVEIQP